MNYFQGVAKHPELKLVPDEPANDTDVDGTLQKLMENDPSTSEVNLNNIKVMIVFLFLWNCYICWSSFFIITWSVGTRFVGSNQLQHIGKISDKFSDPYQILDPLVLYFKLIASWECF